MTNGTELAPELLRRVLVVFAFECCDSLFWREDNGVLTINANCSDFFGWACADCESIETADDVALLEQCRADLVEATGDKYPVWIGELYAARRRKAEPASFMFAGKYAMDEKVQPLFRSGGLA